MEYMQGFRHNSDKYHDELKMFLSGNLKKSVLVSLLGHVTVLSVFSVSFNERFHKPGYADINFRGAFLNNSDIAFSASNRIQQRMGIRSLFNTINTSIFEKNNRVFDLVPVADSLKPPVNLSSNGEKLIFDEEPSFPSQIKREPVIMFYPRLPKYFNIYFKDREVVHIELLFNIVSNNTTKNSIIVMRSISSGNLEADLLSIRYISQYLFIQHSRFTPGKWQTVKIDLSK